MMVEVMVNIQGPHGKNAAYACFTYCAETCFTCFPFVNKQIIPTVDCEYKCIENLDTCDSCEIGQILTSSDSNRKTYASQTSPYVRTG